MTDEALLEVGMLRFGFRPLDTDYDIMKYHKNMMKSLNWDMDKKICSLIWWENKIVSPMIIHYGNYNTGTVKYSHLNNKVRSRYYKKGFIWLITNDLKKTYRLVKPIVLDNTKDIVKKILPDSLGQIIGDLLHGKKK